MDESVEHSPNNQSAKEIEPKNPMRVGISISARWGGWGDIEHGLKIAERLQESPDFQVAVYTPSFATAVMERIPSNLPIVTYKRRPMAYGEFHYIDDEIIPEDVMISVCGGPIPSQDMLPGPRLSIEEFSVPSTPSDLATEQFHITTGFLFDPKKKGTIQAGIPFSRRYEVILQQNAKDKGKLLNSLEESISKQIGKPIKLQNQQLGLYYVSTLETKNTYFDALQLALPHIKGPVTILTSMSSDKPELVREFEEDISRRGFNYISNGTVNNIGSSITVINTSTLPYETFAMAQVVTDLPMVATGDQSLAEAVQKSLSETPFPFFYYCTLTTKEEDFISFIDKIDPDIAGILTAYYLQALPDNECAKGDKLRERFDGRVPSLDEVAKLFYDSSIMERFDRALKQIPQQMIKDREGYVDHPEDLIEVGNAVEKILEAIKTHDEDKLKGLLVR